MPNLIPIHANAVSWVTHFVAGESVDRYWLLYPNPYPKAEHLNRRWHAMPFASQIIETLKKGGELCFATNEKFYADEAVEYWTKFWGLKLVSRRELKPELLNESYRPRTHFEKKYLEDGQSCHDFVFKKV